MEKRQGRKLFDNNKGEKENASKQKEMRVTGIASLLGGNDFDKFMTDQLSHTNRAGAETTLLPIITEPLGPKLFALGELKHFGCSVTRLDSNTSHPPFIKSDQTTATVDRWGHSDKNISLGSLDSHTEVKIVGLGWISDDGIGTNLLTTI